MKKCLLLTLVAVLILLLPSCGTAEIKSQDLPKVDGAEVCASADETPSQNTSDSTFEAACLAEKEEIEKFLNRRLEGEGFELCELWIGSDCMCKSCKEHPGVIKIVGYMIQNGKRRFLWTTSIEIPRELSDYIRAENLFMPENPIEQRCVPGMAVLIEAYLIYGKE